MLGLVGDVFGADGAGKVRRNGISRLGRRSGRMRRLWAATVPDPRGIMELSKAKPPASSKRRENRGAASDVNECDCNECDCAGCWLGTDMQTFFLVDRSSAGV